MADKNDAVPRATPPAHFELPGRPALSTDQVAAVAEFIRQVGGVDNARQALAALVKLKDAA
ncbi:MAG TPA: hypothetical protein VG826_24570 [Pirellulales bacterium]|nr:hypothetical protein [Pirellulales bacterium]